MTDSPAEAFPGAAGVVSAEWGECAWTATDLFWVAVLERHLVDGLRRVPGPIWIPHPDPVVESCYPAVSGYYRR